MLLQHTRSGVACSTTTASNARLPVSRRIAVCCLHKGTTVAAHGSSDAGSLVGHGWNLPQQQQQKQGHLKRNVSAAAAGGAAGSSGGSGALGGGGGGSSGGSSGAAGGGDSSTPHPLRNWTWAYAAFLAVGGTFAFIKAGSQKSLTSAMGAALILALSGRKMLVGSARGSIAVCLAISVFLSVIMAGRYSRSKKVMPAGVTAAASLGMSAAYILSLVA